MIARDAVPTSHVPIYRRIDIRYPCRKSVITGLEVLQNDGREPDAAIYRFDPWQDVWILKDSA